MRLPCEAGVDRDSEIHDAPVNPMKFSYLQFLILNLCLVQAQASVRVEKLPDAGLQPQIVATRDGTVHLIYLTGDPKSSDVLYRRRKGTDAWSDPIRVNSQDGSAIAIGTIRGAQLAVGRRGSVHVVWNGSQFAEPKPILGGSPMLHARLNQDGKSFTPQKNLISQGHELDGGGSVAADADGRVFVFWQASPEGKHGETNRLVYLAKSLDDGNTFSQEVSISPPGTGACGCCGLSAFANPGGETFVLFRNARTTQQRDMMLLASTNHGTTFQESLSHPMQTGMCPMSSASFAGTSSDTWAAWENEGRIYAGRISAQNSTKPPQAIGPSKGAKHPRLATNAKGDVLIVWTEGTGWQRGGAMAWQVLNSRGEPTAEKGRLDDIPAWGFATPYATPDGHFVILH